MSIFREKQSIFVTFLKNCQIPNLCVYDFQTRMKLIIKIRFYKIEITVELNGIEHLHSLLTQLEAEGEVASIKRCRGSKLENIPQE